jgi:hypothetical protein
MIFTSTSYTACFSFHGNQTNKPLYSYKKSRKSPYNLKSLHTVTLTLALKSAKQGKKKEKKKKSLSNLQTFNTIALTLDKLSIIFHYISLKLFMIARQCKSSFI